MVETSRPPAAVECDFAFDSFGFVASRLVCWFDVKHNALRADHDWVKAHIMCGVKTNVITAVEIEGKLAQDAPQPMLATTAAPFTMRELSAD